uniref:Uncharacterized protein n=1 Tax=mine drainage metagenome TaxID=410659 RepID=E6PYP7_9ZZZZ
MGGPAEQGNVFLRTMLVAAARKLAVRRYWMPRPRTPYPEVVRKAVRNEGSPSPSLVG